MNTSDIYERVEEPQIKPIIQTAALVKATKPEEKTFGKVQLGEFYFMV